MAYGQLYGLTGRKPRQLPSYGEKYPYDLLAMKQQEEYRKAVMLQNEKQLSAQTDLGDRQIASQESLFKMGQTYQTQLEAQRQQYATQSQAQSEKLAKSLQDQKMAFDKSQQGTANLINVADLGLKGIGGYKMITGSWPWAGFGSAAAPSGYSAVGAAGTYPATTAGMVEGAGTGSAYGGASGVGLGSYAGTAAPGFIVGSYLGGKEAAGKMSSGKGRIGSAGSGAATGAAMGSWVFPGVGTALGAGIGAVAGLLGFETSRRCIIVTSCTNPDAYEVDITRRFRDNFLDDTTLRGYYRLAGVIVPLIEQYEDMKIWYKENLVDRLIDFGEWFMGVKDRLRFNDSAIVTERFLNTCYLMGAKDA